jgi:NitT/TauT family transport system ATP-binding protein
MIAIHRLRHSFGTGQARRAVLEDIDLSVGRGEFLALVGPSGCGKTTLLNIIAGLETHSGSGSALVDGKSPRAGDKQIAYMLSRDCLLPWRSALRNAGLALQIQGVPRGERDKRARAALESMGLDEFLGAYPAQLSHGMRQRVALARVFATRPRVLLLDEPFSALDAQTRVTVQDAFLRVWQRQSSTVVMVTHDLQEAVALADRVVIMSRRPGRIKSSHEITIPRPRLASELRADATFHALTEKLWQELKDEVIAAETADLRRKHGMDQLD